MWVQGEVSCKWWMKKQFMLMEVLVGGKIMMMEDREGRISGTMFEEERGDGLHCTSDRAHP